MTNQLTRNIAIAGLSFVESLAVVSDAGIAQEPSIPAGVLGTLTARSTSQLNGTFTSAAALAGRIADGDVVDLYWVGGARQGVTVGAHSVNDCPFSGGTGDALPVTTTPMTMCERTQVILTSIGAKQQMVAMACPGSRATFAFHEAAGPSYPLVRTLQAGGSYCWHVNEGVANPLVAITVDKVYVSQDGATTQKVKVGIAYNN